MKSKLIIHCDSSCWWAAAPDYLHANYLQSRVHRDWKRSGRLIQSNHELQWAESARRRLCVTVTLQNKDGDRRSETGTLKRSQRPWHFLYFLPWNLHRAPWEKRELEVNHVPLYILIGGRQWKVYWNRDVRRFRNNHYNHKKSLYFLVENSMLIKQIPTSGHICGEVTGCAQDTKSMCSTRGGYQGMYITFTSAKKKTNQAEPTLVLKPREYITRNPKQRH